MSSAVYYFISFQILTKLIFSHCDFLEGSCSLCNVFTYVSTPAGMQAFYTVNSCGSDAAPTVPSGVVREYFLEAKRVLWDYAPSGKDLINNVDLTDADR